MSKDFALLLAGIVCAALYTCGVAYLGYKEGHAGVVTIQAAWDAQMKMEQEAAQKVEAANKAKTDSLQAQLDQANATYEQSIQTPQVTVASSTAAAVTDGTLGLRNYPATCPARSTGSDATASARAADAAATQALADSISTSIQVIRIGDEADARERQLDAQIVGLQSILKAERAAGPVNETAPNGKH